MNLRRYSLSAVVDDLEGGTDDPAEVYVLTATAFREAAELALLINARRLGSGKWLVRQLRDCTNHGLVEWAVDNRDRSRLISICRAILEDAGGYLQDGFIRGHRPGS